MVEVTPRGLRAALFACAWFLVCAAPPEAFAAGVPVEQATEEQKESARDAFVEARKAFDERRFVDALKGFTASWEIVASPNTHLMMAHTLKELGRDAEAYRAFESVAEQAEAAMAADPKYGKTAEIAREELGKLRKEVALLTVQVQGADDTATLTVEGKKLDREQWGEPVAVMPGTVTVVLSAGGKNEVREVSTTAGGEASLAIAPAAEAVPPSPEPEPEEPDQPPVEEEGPSVQLILAFTAAGIGVAAFGVAGAFGGLALDKHGELEDACGDQPCPERQEDIDQGRTYQTVSNVMIVVGAVGVAAGAALFLTEFLTDDEPEAAGRPRVLVGPGGLSVVGSF